MSEKKDKEKTDAEIAGDEIDRLVKQTEDDQYPGGTILW
jgi:hypothetical protein